MKTIGIVGGLAWSSSIAYYRTIDATMTSSYFTGRLQQRYGLNAVVAERSISGRPRGWPGNGSRFRLPR